MPDGKVTKNNSEIAVAEISGIFGVKGEVRLFLYNEESEFLFEDRQVILSGASRLEVRLKARSGAGRRIIGKIEGITTPEQAQELVGFQILVNEDDFPDPNDGEWYYHEILGLSVQTESGLILGELVEIYQTAPTDVWEVKGEKTVYYIPLLVDTVLDMQDGKIIIKDDAFCPLED